MTKLLRLCLFLLAFSISLYSDTNSTLPKVEKQEIVNIVQLDNQTQQATSQSLKKENCWYSDLPLVFITIILIITTFLYNNPNC